MPLAVLPLPPQLPAHGVWAETWKAEAPVPIVNKANFEKATNGIISSVYLQFLKLMVF